MTAIQAIILGIIEGLTEFLPISSTGHMIIASSVMGIQESEFVKNFEVIIQFGAILAVVVIYWRRFLPNMNFYKKLFTAFLPTAILGFLLKEKVDQFLESVTLVAWALLLGGLVLIWSDYFFAKLHTSGRKTSDLTYIDCIKLGIYQSIALIPGVSRSGATILGGLFLGMSKKEAAEFSFFLAVPTMAAATGYKVLKMGKNIDMGEIHLLAIGLVVSFFVAILAVKLFIGIVSKHGFKAFGYYRVILGLILLAMIYTGRL
jgi:undecaprenyl-diphosphatase